MMWYSSDNIKKKRNILGISMLALPAVLSGALAMICTGIAPAIWVQNLIVMLLGTLFSFAVISKSRKISYTTIAIISSALLFLTLFAKGMDGVHRWINIAVINVNVAMVVLPISLVSIYYLFEANKNIFAFAAIVCNGMILFLQPDASQLLGFSIPIIIILFYKNVRRGVKYSITIMLICLSTFSWIFLDELQPVSYVEDILLLLNGLSPLLLITGVISLLLIPLPYIIFPPEKTRCLSICIGVYYCIIMVSTVFGNFPVPIMGYGISPIIGYWIVFIWYARESNSNIL